MISLASRSVTRAGGRGHSRLARLIALWVPILLAGCVTPEIPADQCPPGTQALPNCPPSEAISDPDFDRWYEYRRWQSDVVTEQDPIQLGIEAEIPIQEARLKLLGSSQRDALYSLAARIYMIENAQHSVDAAYYIFRDDLVGRALLGALCEAVQRGVDVRLLVDSVGSITLNKDWLRALYQCQLEGDFLHNAEGQLTTRRARVQVVIFNALSKVFVNPNRRSHDKILVVDGFVPDKAFVLTGGRNISLSYFGIMADGNPDPDTYMDAELLLRPVAGQADEATVSYVAEIYFSLLYNYRNNRHIQRHVRVDRRSNYAGMERELKQSLAELKALPPVRDSLAAMPDYMASDYHRGEVRLAHEFGNLVNKQVIQEAVANLEKNPNSIMYQLTEADIEEEKHGRLVSPYLFFARYYGPDGDLLLDEVNEIKQWLAGDPERTLEIVTNSVLTSDNFGAQAVVDMSTAPIVLLEEEYVALWRESPEQGELNRELVDSETWRVMLANPQITVYETGRLDDTVFGGEVDYGKLHGKYLFNDQFGFIGTANFDYRSRLFNNEMGFFFVSEGLTEDLEADFESLKSRSYQWGSREWLEMRRRLVEQGGMKGWSTRQQRDIYRFLKGTGLKWYF